MEVAGGAEIRYSFPVEILKGGEAPLRVRSCQAHYAGQSPNCTIVFISLSAAQSKLEADWAEAGEKGSFVGARFAREDSVVGHGRRQKQAHDEHHDWITIRRGICRPCGKTITFLPVFSLPYTHYSLIARSEALRRYFVEGCSWEAAAPPVKDPDRIAGSIHPPPLVSGAGFLPAAIFVLATHRSRRSISWIRSGQRFCHGELPLSWPTVCPAPAPLLAAADLENSGATHHPCLGMRPVFPYARSRRETSTMREDLEQLKQRIPLLEYLQRRNWTGCRVGAREEFVGLCPLHRGYPAFVLCQCPQESVLLSRLSARRRPDPLCGAFSSISPSAKASPA